VYPLDKETKEGRPFWSLPKRPPHPTAFDPTNELHQAFIGACACLYAKIYDLEIPYEKPRSKEAKEEIAKKAEGTTVPVFTLNEQKAS